MAIYSWFTYKKWWFSIAVAAIAMFVYLRGKFSIAMFDPQGIYIYNISQPLLLVRLFEQALWDFLSQPTISLGTSFLKHTGKNTNKNDYQHNLGGIILDLVWWPKKNTSPEYRIYQGGDPTTTRYTYTCHKGFRGDIQYHGGRDCFWHVYWC